MCSSQGYSYKLPAIIAFLGKTDQQSRTTNCTDHKSSKKMARWFITCIVFGLAALSVNAIAGKLAAGFFGNVLDLVDISLHLSNIMNNGCTFIPEICTLRRDIENLQNELKPKYERLDSLGTSNSALYGHLSNIVAQNNDLNHIQNNIEYLVASTVNTFPDRNNILITLGDEFARSSSRNVDIFNANVAKYVLTGDSFNTAKLLYSELKFTYLRLKDDGQWSGFNNFGEALTAIGKVIIKPIVNPEPLRFKKIGLAAHSFVSFINKAEVKPIWEGFDKATPLAFSLYNLGVSLAYDIIGARQIRDSLRTTKSKLKHLKNTIDPAITEQQKFQTDMQAHLQFQKAHFIKMVEAATFASVFINVNVNRLNTPELIRQAQKETISGLAAVTHGMKKIHVKMRQWLIITESVQYNDSLTRIKQRIRGANLTSMTTNQILSVIAKEFPRLSTYDGQNLSNFRG